MDELTNEDPAGEDLTNELIEVIWPALDAGATVDAIRAAFDNALEAWEPAG